ncbi:MAG: hypothetical protein JWP81_504 [Ferruginibacter sp.]|nr:hypothetical protein [Ferruginibacter sp.]
MRKAFKSEESAILKDRLKYIVNNSRNNLKIATILLSEQKGFCAYTDEYLSRTDAKEIEHFNPTLKGTNEDDYCNWFLVKRQWNSEKSTKWVEFQPVLHPTDPNFEQRIIYLDGDYFAASEDDLEALNLIKLLKLDDPALAEKRKKYIARKRQEMEAFQEDAHTFFLNLLDDDYCHLSYLRAIKEEFGIDLWLILE